MRQAFRDNFTLILALLTVFAIADLDAQRLRLRVKAGSSGAVTPPEEPPPSGDSTSDNENFDTLCERPDALFCVDFRSTADADNYSMQAGSTSGAADASYDATEDMGVITWEENEVSSEQLRVSLGNGHPADSAQGSVVNTGTALEHPLVGTQKVLIQIDNKWDESWFSEFLQPGGTRMGGFKWLQISDNNIMFEPNMANIGDPDNSFIVPGEMPMPLAWTYIRLYNFPVPPTENEPPDNGTFCGASIPTDNGGPMIGDCWKFYANRRTRIWIEMTHVAGETVDIGGGVIKPYAHFSVWLADEQQAPLKIVSDWTHTCDSAQHDEFWVEYDTSRPERDGGVMKAWVANLVVLKDYAVAPETLMEKPVGTPAYATTFNDMTTAVLHGQDGWTGFNSAGETAYEVKTTTTFEGAKAIEVPIFTHATITKDLTTPLTRGSAFVRMRKSHTSGSDLYLILADAGGPTKRAYIRFGADGNISGSNNGGGTYTSLQTYAADTWYWLHVEWNLNNQPNKYRFRVIDDTAVPTWSSWLTVEGASLASVGRIIFETEGNGSTATHKGWFDALYVYSSHSTF